PGSFYHHGVSDLGCRGEEDSDCNFGSIGDEKILNSAVSGACGRLHGSPIKNEPGTRGAGLKLRVRPRTPRRKGRLGLSPRSLSTTAPAILIFTADIGPRGAGSGQPRF